MDIHDIKSNTTAGKHWSKKKHINTENVNKKHNKAEEK
jgi:hypothetical protein